MSCRDEILVWCDSFEEALGPEGVLSLRAALLGKVAPPYLGNRLSRRAGKGKGSFLGYGGRSVTAHSFGNGSVNGNRGNGRGDGNHWCEPVHGSNLGVLGGGFGNGLGGCGADEGTGDGPCISF